MKRKAGSAPGGSGNGSVDELEPDHQIGIIQQLTEHKLKRIRRKQPIGFQLTTRRKRKPVTLEE